MILEIVEKQTAIISTQSGIIDEIFRVLLQYLTPEEAGSLPCLKDMKRAAEMRREIEE